MKCVSSVSSDISPPVNKPGGGALEAVECWILLLERGGSEDGLQFLLDFIRSGRGEQGDGGRCLDERGVQDDWQGHGRDSHLQRGGEGLQDEGGLAPGGGSLGGGGC